MGISVQYFPLLFASVIIGSKERQGRSILTERRPFVREGEKITLTFFYPTRPRSPLPQAGCGGRDNHMATVDREAGI